MRDLYELYNNFDIYSDVESELVIEGNVENPQCTIFVPTYKRASTLEITIDSILSQKTDVNYEIIVINNDNNDQETRNILEQKNDKRIYYYVNNKNIGLCGNWNRGIELSRGSYISMIHDDDILSPYFIDSIQKAIKDNSNPGIIGVDYYIFSSDNMPNFEKPQHVNYRLVSKESFFFGRYINIAGITVRKDLILKLGGYSEEYYPNEDTNLIFQALNHDTVINVNYPLAGYRKEINASLTGDTMKNIIIMTEKTRRNIAEHEDFAKKWLKKYDKEFLNQYISGAILSWGLDIDYKEIFSEFGFNDKRPSIIKQILMKIELKFRRRSFK